MSGFDQKIMVEQAALESEQAEELAFIEADFEALYGLMTEKSNDPYMKSLRERISDLEQQLADVSEPYDAAIRDHQDSIRNAILQQEKSFKCQFGKATFRHGPTSIKWDDGALLKYAKEHEDFEKMVKYFRTESIGKASVSISVGEQQC